MQENNMRLIDEALSSEPIKNTFRLGWEFVTLNKKFTMSMMVVILVLTLLSMIPILGVVFSVFSTALILSIQIYAGRLVYETENIETFVDEVHNADGETIVKSYFAPALGAYMGWMVMGLLLIGVITLMIGGMGGVSENMNNTQLLTLMSGIGLPLLLVLLLFSYVQPLVQANIVMSNDFKEGFFALFTIFSADVWQRAMQGSYFKYMFWLGLVVMGMSLLFGFLFSIFGAIPFLNIFIMIIFVYIFTVIMTVAAMMAKRLVE